MDDLLGSSFTPVAGIRHSKSCQALNQGGNQHGLVTGQDGLADRDLAAGLVMSLHSPSTVRAVGLVREGLLDFAILVAVETTVLYTVNVCASPLGSNTTYHRQRRGIRSRFRVPLHRHLAGRTSVGAIVARLARLIRAHGPATVHGAWGDGHQASITGKLALAASLLVHILLVMMTVVQMAVVVLRGLGGDGTKQSGSVNESHIEAN